MHWAERWGLLAGGLLGCAGVDGTAHESASAGPAMSDAAAVGSAADASSVGPSMPPSCQARGAGQTDCGATRESCCTSIEVVGGTFYRTYANDGTGAIGLADPATVSS